MRETRFGTATALPAVRGSKRKTCVPGAALAQLDELDAGSLWYSGVSRVSGTTASAFMGVMPVSALLLSYLLLGDSFEPFHLVGMVAVLAGIAAVVHSERTAPGA